MVWIFAGAVAGAVGVALGAFGAHGLKGRLTPELRDAFETGVRYQMYHALALVAVGLLASRGTHGWLLTAVGVLFLAGIVIFSGSLYALALTGARGLGALTPLGGVCLILAWLILAVLSLPI
jgi:uncharacterized membrane protein YgdD (TMEM256/DUF423 family)